MSFSRAWMVLSLAWAATSLLLASMAADALWDNGFLSAAFFWLLLVASALIPLAHEFVHPQRPYRRAILICAIAGAALFAYALAGGWRGRDIYWIPLIWAAVLCLSDWLFVRAQPALTARTFSNDGVRVRLRGYAADNIDRAIEGFDANAEEFKKVFLDEQPQDGSDFGVGSLSLHSVKDFLATKFGLEVAIAAFYIVFQRVYDDPRQSEVHSQLRKHLSNKLSEISFPDQEERQPYLTTADFQKVWELVGDPKYAGKMDELRLAVAMTGLFVGTKLKPPLSRDEDRETLLLLVKRSLNRMRICLQQ